MSEKTSKQRKQDTIVITILILCSLFITFPDDVDNLVMDEKYDDVQVYVIMETSADYRGKGNNRIMTAEEFCCSSRSLLTILQKRGVLTRSWYLSCEREF
ncbi:MAG: hypothetical protein OEY07_20440, partial [Gammaproteobacteria bacterium]|nr:hypothetical protein [Gammaproteobacteria bacterium]